VLYILIASDDNKMADAKEMIFSETDGSCAYCGIKDYRVLTTHHIIQQDPKDESYDNKIVLCHNCHHLYHQGKGPSLQELKDIKKRLICKTLTQQGVNALREAYRKGLVVASPYLVNHLLELQFLTSPDSIATYSDNGGECIIDAAYRLTDKGKLFTEKWGFN
jgi:hypothetical protein